MIASGAVGPVRMLTTLNFTTWIYRPRRPEELAAGSAGVVLNQASHQVDIVRLLAGGRATSVRASTGVWDAERPAIGAYSALLQFEDGVAASMTYSGYDHFDTDEFNGWIGELGRRKPSDAYGTARQRLMDSAANNSEGAHKAGVGYAGMVDAPKADIVDLASQWHQQFGLVLVSCDRADLRISGTGITIYGDKGVTHSLVVPDTLALEQASLTNFMQLSSTMSRCCIPAAGAWPISRSASRCCSRRANRAK